MASKTGISWTDTTWNCIRGCSRVSEGCRNCYAEHQAARIVRMGKGKPTAYDELVRVTPAGEPRWTGKVALDPKALALPLSWRTPRRVFVNSMSDLFHESLTNEQIAAVFGVMAAAPQHTFQVLTKRARRMREWFEWAARRPDDYEAWHRAALECSRRAFGHLEWHPALAESNTKASRLWPLPNVWLGVSVENQDAAIERVPDLLHAPAVVRFLSCEPLLGPVDVRSIPYAWGVGVLHNMNALTGYGGWTKPRWEHRVHWVIAGCESGPSARPCGVEWLRSLRDQCADAGVAFFLKQAMQPGSEAVGGPLVTPGDGSKRKAGGVIERPNLDGMQWLQFPEIRS